MRVIAEGVETEWQLAFLRDNNCDDVQGYFFSPPVPPKDIERFIAAGQAGAETIPAPVAPLPLLQPIRKAD